MKSTNRKQNIKKCKICGSEYEKKRMEHIVCSPACAIEYAKKWQAKQDEIRLKEERRLIRQKKEKLQTLSDINKKAQRAFNAYIRERDKGNPCISCQAPYREGFGGKFDAGHYRSRGSAPHLRFNENNCHGQCVKCNRYRGGNSIGYRYGLIQKIGLQAVEELEQNNEVKKFTREDLINIHQEYKQKLKELK